jgi:acetolactate synthase-1/2/3 large subunit
MPSGGEIVVACLKAQGVERVFCVPGESYLPVLAALDGSGIAVVACRHEGAAAMMAEADGKMTGRPGVALATRGPGATNAAAGVHVARQDSTPMVLLVGQVGRGMRGRECFQEVDYAATFRDLAKWAAEADSAARLPEWLSRAFAAAMAGRPGPAVLALPEDVLRETADVAPGPCAVAAEPAPTPEAVAEAARLLRAAERPVAVLGGSRWSAGDAAAAGEFALDWDVPTAVSFRRQGLAPVAHPAFAGHAGLGVDPALRARVAEADLVLLLGARFSENPSQGFTLMDLPRPRQRLIHVHPGAEELGRLYAPDVAICATPGAFLRAMAAETPPPATGRIGPAHDAALAWHAPRPAPDPDGPVEMGAVVAHLAQTLPADAILTNGAGNYAIWLHRFFPWRGYGTQLAPTSGSMGYGLPAAIAAKLRHPGRAVVCLAGDGCFQMTMQELGTAAQAGAGVVVLVADNGMWGTIRMHQARDFPGRDAATRLRNPDFAAVARAYGAHAERVRRAGDFPAAFARARAAAEDRPALLHLLTDPAAVSPTMRLGAD